YIRIRLEAGPGGAMNAHRTPEEDEMTHRLYRMTTAGIALGLLAPSMALPAAAKPVDKETAWGAATAVATVGAVVNAAKDRPLEAIALGAGAVYSYTQYDKARNDDRYDDRYDSRNGNGRYNDNDPYNYDRYDRGPSWRGDAGNT